MTDHIITDAGHRFRHWWGWYDLSQKGGMENAQHGSVGAALYGFYSEESELISEGMGIVKQIGAVSAVMEREPGYWK